MVENKYYIEDSSSRKISGILILNKGEISIDINGNIIPLKDLFVGYNEYDIQIILSDNFKKLKN